MSINKYDILNILKDCNIKIQQSQPFTEDNFEKLILERLPDNFLFDHACGASKLCIMPWDVDYVIKIPFEGKYYRDGSFERFQNANYDKKRFWDYCFTELLFYHYVKTRKIGKCFCKTSLLGYVNDYPIYIQEKAEPLDEIELLSLDVKKSEITKAKKYSKKNNLDINPMWVANAIKYYGQKTFNQVTNFISEYEIEDLHDSNIGYIADRPVFIDYSDFRG